MAEITAAAVKELRERSGAGMMDCKKALEATNGDAEAAFDHLRKMGQAAAAKKSTRAAAEGLVAVRAEGSKGVLVEVNSETDFVARNETFQGFVDTVAGLALKVDGDIEKQRASAYPGSGRSVADEVAALVGSIGENINLRRSTVLSVEEGVVAGYVHNQVVPGMGKIGVLVGLESAGDAGKLGALGRQIAMHVAAAQPQFVSVDKVDQASLARERAVLTEQARASGRPEEIIAKMVEGRLRKYYEDVVLLEQLWVIDGETRVSKVIEQAAKDVGAPVKLTGFVRFLVGEGVDRRSDDFAAEVARLTA